MWLVLVDAIYSKKLMLTLKKNFTWKFFQKLIKSTNFIIYLHIDLKDLTIFKYWFKIHNPGEISIHLIGHTIYFHKKIRFSYFEPPLLSLPIKAALADRKKVVKVEFSPGWFFLSMFFMLWIFFLCMFAIRLPKIGDPRKNCF